MTEGIIQEVFKSMIKKHDFALQAELIIEQDRKILEEVINVLEITEQELIEKIKQRFPIDYDENYAMWHEAIQQILIGDNND